MSEVGNQSVFKMRKLKILDVSSLINVNNQKNWNHEITSCKILPNPYFVTIQTSCS